MKLLILLTVVACLQVSATGYGQTVTLSVKNTALEKVFKEVKRQTGFSFVYTRDQLKNSLPVTCNVVKTELKEVLSICFSNQPLSFIIEGNYVVVQTKNAAKRAIPKFDSTIDVRGRVLNETGEPLAGATITLKSANKSTFTNQKGEFSFKGIGENDVMIITNIGYSKQEILINKTGDDILIQLKVAIGNLDETIVIAYGKTSQRLSTGNVGKVNAAEIGKQPVSNILGALHGRIPGLVITQNTGITGGKFNVQIRGRNSITQGSEPLFIIDGVPFAPNNNNVNQLTSALSSFAGQGLSPFSSLNPLDIESIEVLKDADATAIYGSRGANGVILITTKKGIAGKTKISINVNKGFSKITKTMKMLNTEQYLSMRNEAFRNDGVTPDIFSAPDLLAWDTTRYTDFKKIFIEGTADITDAQTSISGGNTNTQFLIGGSYHKETTVFPGDFNYKRGSLNFNINHNSTNKKFNIGLSASYNTDKNKLPVIDYTSFQTLPPDLPALYDSTGKLNWEMGGVSFDNPMAYLSQSYTVTSDNLLSNLQLSYKLVEGLTAKISLGYNTTTVDEKNAIPKSSQNPQNAVIGTASFGYNRFKSWIAEPQIEYNKNIGKGKLAVLFGGTLQQIINTKSTIQASGYANDAMLGSTAGASKIIVYDASNRYKYGAVFGRLNYNYGDKYIVNFTGRRDGSSRFGPDKRFANFFAGGAAWLFSNEPFLKNSTKYLSFGKLRASYGTTGNDQIGDYQYLDVWSNSPYPYQGPSVTPLRLLNRDYSWEVNRKMEFGIDLGFLKDDILLSAVYYLNKSSNQLINYRLPGQTGFTSIIKNFPAVVSNEGFEFSFTSKNLNTKNFKWNLSANITIPKNKLNSFQGLASSSYSKSYVIGKSLNIVYGYHLLGVDPNTGVYQFEDVNKDGAIGAEDYIPTYNLDPKFYGGFNNSFNYKGWELNLFFEFKKQIGYNYNNYPVYNFTPGGMYNLPVIFLDRWQTPGNNFPIQQFTQTYTAAYDGQYYFSLSDGRFSDASYLRLKNASMSYNFPETFLKRLRFQNMKIYILAQNLLTITNYKGSDPETLNLFALPPLKTITAGIQLNF
jgi:TonB-linked SusC/RagA family outer membrane protein